MDINQIIDHIGKLPEASKNTLKEIISEVTYPKGHFYLKQIKWKPRCTSSRKELSAPILS